MTRVWQFLSTISYGDAVSNDCLAMASLLTEKGIDNRISARFNHLKGNNDVIRLEKAKKEIRPEDRVLLHLSTGDEMNDWFASLPNKKAVVYHNITPAKFFRQYNSVLSSNASDGREQAARMASSVDLAITVSSYNAKELEEMGFPKPHVIPILMPFEDYAKEPDSKRMQELSDGRTNIFFVGRVAPNKCQEDIVSVFSEYVKQYDPTARLILAGSATGTELYRDRIVSFIEKLGLSGQVILPGHTTFAEILAFYKTADAFLIMSEHEGFCVPIVESFLFGVPVLACDYGAIGETMGTGGILLSGKDPSKTAAVLHEMITDKALRDELKNNMKKELERFETGRVKAQLWDVLLPWLGNEAQI